MFGKKSSGTSSATAVSSKLQESYHHFMQAVIVYLRTPDASVEQHQKELKALEHEAVKFNKELPEASEGGPLIEAVVRYAREYYPTEGDSREFQAACETLGAWMQKQWGIR